MVHLEVASSCLTEYGAISTGSEHKRKELIPVQGLPARLPAGRLPASQERGGFKRPIRAFD